MIGITTEWSHLAEALELNQADIDGIAANKGGNVEACLTEVIKQWFMERGIALSWENLCEALRDPMVNRDDLAKKIEKDYR